MVVVQIVGIISYILASIGNGLLIGIAHYEKFGQDPQKRSFQDRIISYNCLLYAFINFITGTILEIRSLFGPIGNFGTLLRYFLSSLMLSIPIGYAECILFKCLLVFFWKKFAAINDEFFATFFNMFNLMIGLIISIVRLTNGEFFLRYDYGILSGIDISKNMDEYV